MADYETSKYTIPASADGVIPATAIADNALTAAEIAANAIEASELATNAVTTDKIIADAVTTAKILDLNVTGGKIADSTIVATTKLSATGTKSASTFLAGDNTWKTIASAAISSVRYKSLNQSITASGGNGSIPAQTWVYTATGNEVVICTFSYRGVSTGTGGNDKPGVSDYNVSSSTTGTLIGHNFEVMGSRDIRISGNTFIASLTSGQTATVTRSASATLVTQGQSATWTSNGFMIVQAATASTF